MVGKSKKKKGKGWSSMPKGWTSQSVQKFVLTLTEDNPDHPFTACVDKMEGKMDNPQAFCGATLDQFYGHTSWRSSKKAQHTAAVKYVMRRKYGDQYEH